MKKLIIIIGLFLLTACATVKMSPKQAIDKMSEEENYIIVDVRTKEEYDEKHIKDAINIPLASIGDKMPDELPDLDENIYVYCRSGNRSKQAARKLADLGYTNIIEFGGILDYSGEIEKGGQQSF